MSPCFTLIPIAHVLHCSPRKFGFTVLGFSHLLARFRSVVSTSKTSSIVWVGFSSMSFAHVLSSLQGGSALLRALAHLLTCLSRDWTCAVAFADTSTHGLRNHTSTLLGAHLSACLIRCTLSDVRLSQLRFRRFRVRVPQPTSRHAIDVVELLPVGMVEVVLFTNDENGCFEVLFQHLEHERLFAILVPRCLKVGVVVAPLAQTCDVVAPAFGKVQCATQVALAVPSVTNLVDAAKHIEMIGSNVFRTQGLPPVDL